MAMVCASPSLPGMVTVSALNRLNGIRHAFFTREGGVSEGAYASLNCSYLVGDDALHVAANRAAAMAALDLPAASLASVQQIHSSDVVLVDEMWTADRQPPADGLVTRRVGIALGVLGADCAAVLLADPVARVVGAAHAGWRGALSGIVENTIGGMVELGAQASRVVAAIGPCIGPRSYEVGPEFPAPFLIQDPDNAVYFRAGGKPGLQLFDLPGYIAHRLTKLGAHVVPTPCDTVREGDRFFSHRRAQLFGEPACGRTLSVIFIEP